MLYPEDMEYFEECMNAKFFIYKDKILACDLVELPSDNQLEKDLLKYSIYQVEGTLNHFHMCFISADIKIQKECAIKIWEKWREFFQINLPNEIVEIEIADTGSEIILTVCRPWAKSSE